MRNPWEKEGVFQALQHVQREALPLTPLVAPTDYLLHWFPERTYSKTSRWGGKANLPPEHPLLRLLKATNRNGQETAAKLVV